MPPTLPTSPALTAKEKREGKLAGRRVVPESRLDASSGEKVELTSDTWVEIVDIATADSVDALNCYQQRWVELAEQALEPNVFHEFWMLTSSLKNISHSTNCRFVFAFHRNKRVTDPPILSGVFPLMQESGSILRLSSYRLLTNIYSYLATPLLHPRYQHEAIKSLIFWGRKTGVSLLEFPRIHAHGPFQQALIDVLNQLNLSPFIVEQHNRALLTRDTNTEAYQLKNISGHSRRDHRRLRRRLQEQGELEFRTLDDPESVKSWANQFLALEQKGWKGEQGTAIGQRERDQAFFHEVTTEGMRQGKLQMMGLFLDGKPIAMKCNLISGQGGFAWKIAYDEQYARFSPGVHLELENIKYLHEQTDLEWMDSCATAEHFMINRLWPARRTIQHLLIPTGNFTGELYTGLRPLIRTCRRIFRSRFSPRQSQ